MFGKPHLTVNSVAGDQRCRSNKATRLCCRDIDEVGYHFNPSRCNGTLTIQPLSTLFNADGKSPYSASHCSKVTVRGAMKDDISPIIHGPICNDELHLACCNERNLRTLIHRKDVDTLWRECGTCKSIILMYRPKA